MKRELLFTADGSHTISIPEINVTYHSKFGAIQESKHIFINAGLHHQLHQSNKTNTINIFEMGFGTGLNALLTFKEAAIHQLKVFYETVELYPVDDSQLKQLNYCEQLGEPTLQPAFDQLHGCAWNNAIAISSFFQFKKYNIGLTQYSSDTIFDLVYFDAFAPEVQPELWTENVFQQISNHMRAGAILVTYCSKSIVRKALQVAGFSIEKIPGPPGKREIVRATKLG